MNQVFYLEADEEITSVIGKIRKAESNGVVLVLPRSGAVGQSVINLKLLKRSGEKTKKGIGLVSSDNVTKNLAAQIGLPVFAKVAEAETANLAMLEAVEAPIDLENGPIKVNTYKKYDLSSLNEQTAGEDEMAPEEIEEAMEPDGDQVEEESDAAADLAEASGGAGDDDASDTPDDDSAEEESEDLPNEETEAETATQEVETLVTTENKKTETQKPAPNNQKEASVSSRHINPRGTRKVLAIFAIILLVLALAGSYILLPTMKVALMVKAEDLKLTYSVVADRDHEDNSLTDLAIPAKVYDTQKDETKDFAATGTKDAGTQASGKVTISNTISLSPVIVGNNSKAVTSDGKSYNIAKGVSVPAAKPSNENCTLQNGQQVCPLVAGTAEVDVVADATGESYNVAAGTRFVVGKMTAENKAEIAGGLTKSVKVVTADDLSKAQVELEAKAMTEGKAELTTTITEDKVTTEDKSFSQETTSVVASKQADEVADTFNLKTTVKIYAVGFLESDITNFAVQYTTTKILDDQMILNPDKIIINYVVKEIDSKNATIKFDLDSTAKIGQKIDTAKIKFDIKNKRVTAAKKSLDGIKGVEGASYTIWPKFMVMTPILDSKITVNFDYQQ